LPEIERVQAGQDKDRGGDHDQHHARQKENGSNVVHGLHQDILPPPFSPNTQDIAMRPFGLIVSVLCVLNAADGKDDAAKKDLEKFQGKWQLISMERDGKKTPPEDAKKITLSIQGDKFVLRKDAVIISEGTMTLDPTQKQKTIDETITTGPNKGKVFSAIYEIDDEHHKICFAAAGKERPTAFTSGNGQLFQVWKREKKK
jgi:uncharacterized protein (TIGR03067 family)